MNGKLLLGLSLIVIAISGCITGYTIENTQEQDYNNIDYNDYYRVPPTPSCSFGSTYCNGKCWNECPEGYEFNCPSLGSPTCIPVEQEQTSSNIIRQYYWEYGGSIWEWTGVFTVELYNFYRSKPRTGKYSDYVTDKNDDLIMGQLIKVFNEAATQKGYNEYETINFVISFVQSLPYTSDDVTTPYDDPRYPIETLVDNGGDCEDTSILTASLLKEMGYDVVLLNPPGHMAIGVWCDRCSNTILYNGRRYAYLETIGEGWEIGDIPKEYRGVSVRIIPLY